MRSWRGNAIRLYDTETAVRSKSLAGATACVDNLSKTKSADPHSICGNEGPMATFEFELVDPPTEQRALELWLQHAAGFIFFEDIRRYAMEQIDPALPAEARAAVQKGIDDAVYGLMMVIDGVSGGVRNASRSVHVDFIVRLTTRSDSERGVVLSEVDLRQGDGMCMGYHGWREGDFGNTPIAAPRSNS